jgi:hypothetical protein
MVHGHVREREAAVRHQHGSHEREAGASQGDSSAQVSEVTVLGGPRRAIQSRRTIREENTGHDRHGEQERRPKKGALPATEGLVP